MIKVAVLGYGTVGSGIVDVLNVNKDAITKKVGEEVSVAYVLDLREFPGQEVEKILVHDYDIIINDSEVKVVAEAMGGVEPAYTFAKKALESGKSFCTSNKELVAKHGAELIALAKEKNLCFMFEASVGGGIPIIRPLNESLASEQIVEITGILNGTTNYMMSKMADEGLDFDTVLKIAQDKGYAERNPEADIEGYDACRKIAILSSLAFGQQVDFEDIYTEGITKITDEDISYAKLMGKAIKLLGTSFKTEDGVSAMVAPFLVSQDSPLYAVKNVFNAITVKGNMLGEVMFYGKGAGKNATASAVVSDIIQEARHIGKHVPCIWSPEKLELCAKDNIVSKFFVRLSGNQDECAKKAKEVFGNIDEVEAIKNSEYAFETDSMKEKDFEEKIAKFDNLVSRIRIKE